MTSHQRDLQSIVADGVLFSVMVGLGESYVPAFALALGFGAVSAGLLATLPMLAGGVIQLITPAAIRRLGSYRRWVVLCAQLQALSFAPLLVGAMRGELRVEWLAAGCVGYWAFGMATGPAWNAWVTTLVPVEERAGFFAHRTRAAQTALVVALLTGGFLLELGRERGSERFFFGVLFVGAMGARLGSSLFLRRQSEAPGLASSHPAVPLREIYAELQAGGSLRLLA